MEGASPYWPALLAFFTLLLILLLAARLLVMVPFLTPEVVGLHRYRVLKASAWVLLLGGSAGVVIGLPHIDDHVIADVVAISAVAATVGVFFRAQSLACRLRVDLRVRDSSGKMSASGKDHLAVVVSNLAGDRTHAVLYAAGTDVTLLNESAVDGQPDNIVVAWIHRVTQALLGTTPWVITVGVESDDEVSVAMTRNGTGVQAVSIARSELGLTGLVTAGGEERRPMPDLMKLAAASIVATLAARHRGFEGLCGASKWRSIGLHYIATTDFKNDGERAIPLLRRSLEEDSNNLQARLALEYHLHRQATQKEELSVYAARLLKLNEKVVAVYCGGDERWLDFQTQRVTRWGLGLKKWSRIRGTADSGTANGGASPPRGEVSKWVDRQTRREFVSFRLRLMLNYLTAVLNLKGVAKGETEQWDIAKKMLGDLDKLIARNAGTGRVPKETEAMATLYHELFRIGPMGEAPAVSSEPPANQDGAFEMPLLSYNRACKFAALYGHDREHDQDLAKSHREQTLEDLRNACLSPRLRDWAWKDPWLEPLHGDAEFRTLVGGLARTDFWELEPFVRCREELTRAGVPTPSSLARLVDTRGELRRHLVTLGLTLPELERLLRLSRLIGWIERQADIESFTVEIAASLIDLGVEMPEELGDAHETARNVKTAIAGRCFLAPEVKVLEKALTAWPASADRVTD